MLRVEFFIRRRFTTNEITRSACRCRCFLFWKRKKNNDSRTQWLNARVISWQQLCSWSYHIWNYWIFLSMNEIRRNENKNKTIASDFQNANDHSFIRILQIFEAATALYTTIYKDIDLIIETCVSTLFRHTTHIYISTNSFIYGMKNESAHSRNGAE